MVIALHFPFRFDTESLRADLATARTVEWPPHYNERDYGGGWSGVALRSANGASNQLIAGPGGNPVFTNTPLLERCPHFRHVLSVFRCPLKSARLLSLAPQSFIREHSDYALGYDDGEIRIHVPIQTNPDVEFYVAGERLLLEEGHSYFVNVNLPHRVNNRGRAERVHLVIDAEVNEWVHALFRQGAAEGWHVPRCPRPPGNVDDFRRHVLTVPALRQKLQAIEHRGKFEDTAMELGRDLGFDFHEGDIDAAFRCGPMPAIEDDREVAGWTPVRVFFRERRPFAEWVCTGTKRFTEPYFDDSVRAALQSPFAQFFRREMPLEIAAEKTPEPSGFIFHMSRCGSTLIAQMLASLPRHLVISEAPPLDEVIQATREIPDLSPEEHIQWLRGIVHALGRGCSSDERKYFIKMDAWHIHSLALIRAAFPETPWIFVWRDPLEVLVSQLIRPGRLSIPGAVDSRIFGLEPADAVGLSREEWCARVLARILRSALAAFNDPRALFIHYRELPEAVFGPVSRHFGISLAGDDSIRIREAASFDAKSPGLPFQPDSDEKQSKATPLVRELCSSLLKPMYRELIDLCQTC